MKTAKVFTDDNSQSVLLPEEYRFKDNSVYIKKIDGVVMLIPKHKLWEIAEDTLKKIPKE